jgi:hypothetical protein
MGKLTVPKELACQWVPYMHIVISFSRPIIYGTIYALPFGRSYPLLGYGSSWYVTATPARTHWAFPVSPTHPVMFDLHCGQLGVKTLGGTVVAKPQV